MGGSLGSESEREEEEEEEEQQQWPSKSREEEEEEDQDYHSLISTTSSPTSASASASKKETLALNPSSPDAVDAKLRSLKLKYSKPHSSKPNPNPSNAVKLYLHVRGNTPHAKWINSEKQTSFAFLTGDPDEEDGYDEDEERNEWFLDVDLQLKSFPDQCRIDSVGRQCMGNLVPLCRSLRPLPGNLQEVPLREYLWSRGHGWEQGLNLWHGQRHDMGGCR